MILSFSVPYDPNLSKNKRYADKRSKHINPKHKAAREAVAWWCKIAMQKAGIRQAPVVKLWFSVTVFMPNHCADSHNFIDDFFDACEPILGVDDRWYAIAKWDFAFDKKNPRIECSISDKRDLLL